MKNEKSCNASKLKISLEKTKRSGIEEYLNTMRETLVEKGEAILQIKVSPGAEKTKWHSLLDGEKPIAKLRVVAAPEKGKANSMITKFIQKEFNCHTEITSGHTSSTKLLKLWK